MRINRIIVVVMQAVLLLVFVVACSAGNSSLTFSGGKIYVGGRGEQKQVFLRQGDSARAITQFRPWEEIQELLLSKDEKLLLIAHRADKARAYELTVMRMDSLKAVNSVKPGHGGELLWTNHNTILLTYGCGSNCGGFKLFSDSLKTLADDGGYCLETSIDEDIIVAYPCIAATSEFKVWSLQYGTLLARKAFDKKYGVGWYICDEPHAKDGELSFVLTLPDDRTVHETVRYRPVR